MSRDRPNSTRPIPEIDAPVVIAALEDGERLTLLDCREPYEWEQARIPGSLHIPMHEIPSNLGELAGKTKIVVFCAHGIRSAAVAEYLINQGISAWSLNGGIVDWYQKGGNVEIGSP